MAIAFYLRPDNELTNEFKSRILVDRFLYLVKLIIKFVGVMVFYQYVYKSLVWRDLNSSIYYVHT